jgi:hypothetical protein
LASPKAEKINKEKGKNHKTKDREQKTEEGRETIDDKKQKKKGTKKDKNSRNRVFLREILKNGVAGGSKKGDFIGLMRFWVKNEGKNEHFLIRN